MGLGGMGGPAMLGMGGGKLWGPPWPPGPPCMLWKFLLSVGPELIQGGRFCCGHTHTKIFNSTSHTHTHTVATETLLHTGGGWLLLLGPEARGAPPWLLE